MKGRRISLSGGCHCGGLRYVLEWPAAATVIPARKCACRYCTRFNGTWTSHPDAVLRLERAPSAPPGRYRFGTGTADFLFCSVCGVVVAALSKAPKGMVAVVNVNTLASVAGLGLDRSESDFDGETTEDRLARRARRWIGQVVFE